ALGELAIHATLNRATKRDGGDEVDEPGEVGRIDLELGVVPVEDALSVDSRRAIANPSGCPSGQSMSPCSLRVLLFHRLQRDVDEPAEGGEFVGVGETPTLLEFVQLTEKGLGGGVRHSAGMADMLTVGGGGGRGKLAVIAGRAAGLTGGPLR